MMIPRGRSWPVLCALAALLFCGLSPLGVAVAQEAEAPRRQAVVMTPKAEPARPKAAAAKPAPKSELCIYNLENTDADSVAETLSRILSGMDDPFTGRAVSLTTDKRLNALLVAAPPETQRQIEALLVKLDVPDQSDRAGAVGVYRFKYVEPTMLMDVLSAVLESKDARVAMDDRNNAVILSGPPEAHQQMRTLLETLDVPTARDNANAAVPCRVRVVWLADGLGEDESAEPSKDIKEVVDELATIGIEGLRQVGQVIIGATPGEEFQVDSMPTLGELPTEWQISGQLDERQGAATLSVTLGVMLLSADGKSQRMIGLETKISTPHGHYVVLGTTPVQGKTSVFVVQIVPSEK